MITRLCVTLALLASSASMAGANSLQKNRAIFDQVGNQLSYFESKYGSPKNIFGATRIYRIGDCDFYVELSEKNEIKKIGFGFVSKSCDVVPKNYKLTVSRMTLKDFSPAPDDVRAFCIYSCGNAADPTLDFLIEEPHVNNFLNRVVAVTVPSDFSDYVVKRNGEKSTQDMKIDWDMYLETAIKSAGRAKIVSYFEGYGLTTADIGK